MTDYAEILDADEVEIIDGADVEIIEAEECFEVTDAEIEALKMLIKSEAKNMIRYRNIVVNEIDGFIRNYMFVLDALDGKVKYEGILPNGTMRWRGRQS